MLECLCIAYDGLFTTLLNGASPSSLRRENRKAFGVLVYPPLNSGKKKMIHHYVKEHIIKLFPFQITIKLPHQVLLFFSLVLRYVLILFFLFLFVCLFLVFGFFNQNISCEHYFSCLLLQAYSVG